MSIFSFNRFDLKAVLCILLLSASLSRLSAQSSIPADDYTSNPTDSYAGGAIDTVNLSNQKLSLHIPLVSYPQRGSLLHFGFDINYQSFSYTQLRDGWHVDGGPSVNPDFAFGAQRLDDTVEAPDGSHPMAQISGTSNYIATDGSGYQSTSNGIIDRHGIVSTLGITEGLYSGSLTDPNGNSITATGTLVGTFQWSDTMGRVVQDPSEFNLTASSATCPGPLPATAYSWSVPGYNGVPQVYTFCYVSAGELYTTAAGGLGFDSDQLQTIILPDGSSYGFQYDVGSSGTTYGDLTKITLPTGGSISYTWTTFSLPNQCDRNYEGTGEIPHFVRALYSRTEDPGNGRPTATTYYLTGPINTGSGFSTQNNVGASTDAYGSIYGVVELNAIASITHVFSGVSGSCAYAEIDTEWPDQYRQINSRQTTYDGNISAGNTANMPEIWATSITTDTSYTTITPSTGSTQIINSTVYGYCGGVWTNCPTTISYTAHFGQAQSTSTYDTHGNLLQSTAYSYLWQSNSSYLSAGLLDLLSSKVISGPSGRAAETDYEYDEPSYLTTSSIGTSQQHGASSNGLRGNNTTIKRWLNSGGTGRFIPVHTNWYDTGVPYQLIDPLGNTSTFTYSYAGIFPTTMTNALTQPASADFDPSTGLQISSQDVSGRTTTFNYYSNGKPQSIIQPQTDAGGNHAETDFSYPDFATTLVKQRVDSGDWTQSYVQVDGLGRNNRNLVYNGSTWTETDTCYDNSGNVAFQSAPHDSSGISASPICTGIGDSFSYDEMNRLVEVQHPDGSTIGTYYPAPDVVETVSEGHPANSVDPNGWSAKDTVTVFDALGRAIVVSEAESPYSYDAGVQALVETTGGEAYETPPIIGSYGVWGEGGWNGLETDYAYDTLGNLISIQQLGLPARKFTYDSLSRLTSEFNLETDYATYQYDDADRMQWRTRPSPNLPCTRVSQAGQFCTAALTTTNYGYDTINRPTHIWVTTPDSRGEPYAGLFTPTLQFTYDSNSSISGIQGRGSLLGWSNDLTATGVTVLNPNGSVTTQQTNSLGSGSYQQTQTINLLGEVTSVAPSVSSSVNWTYDSAGSVQQVYLQSFTGQTSVVTGATNSTAYSSMTLGNGHTYAATLDTRGRLSSISVGPAGGTAVYQSSISYAPDSTILSTSDSVNGTWSHYRDEYNRLVESDSNSGPFANLAAKWSYDIYGNRVSQTGTSLPGTSGYSGSLTQANFSYSTPTNRIDGYCYDAVGNVLDTGGCPGTGTPHQFDYDSEGRLVYAGGVYYVYDALGNRIQRLDNNLNAYQDYLIGLDGSQIAVISGVGTPSPTLNRLNIYVGGQVLASQMSDGQLYYNYGDWTGTVRYQTDPSGAVTETCSGLPFGDSITCTGTPTEPTALHFLGLEHDAESGLEFLGARHYAATIGRWIRPDPAGMAAADLSNPQSLNLYAYSLNDPITLSDPSGLDPSICGGSEDGSGGECNGHEGEYLDNIEEMQTGIDPLACFRSPGCGTSGSGGGGFWNALGNFFSGFQPGSGLTDDEEQKEWEMDTFRTQTERATQNGIGDSVLRFANQPWVSKTLTNAGTFSSGAGDFLSFGLTKKINQWDGGSAFINYNSGAYHAGAITGMGIGIADAASTILTVGALREGGAALRAGKQVPGGLFGRGGPQGGGLFNRGFIRFGMSWDGTRGATGVPVIRMGIGRIFPHIPVWFPGYLPFWGPI